MRNYELMPPVNLQLSNLVHGSNGFEVGDGEYMPHTFDAGTCLAVWSIGVEGLDEDNIADDVHDWCNLTGRWSDEEESCEASAWAVLCDETGQRVAVDLDAFPSGEQIVLTTALRASVAHNEAA